MISRRRVRRTMAQPLAVCLALVTAACSGASGAAPPATVGATTGQEELGHATTSDTLVATADTLVTTADTLDATADTLVTTTDTLVTTTETVTTTTLGPLPTVRWDVADAPGGWAQTQQLTGGFGLETYVVDSADDDGPGTYRDALSSGDRHVVFDPSMDGRVIDLAREVLADGSNITLDGSGVDVTVTGRATKFRGTNVIVAGMAYVDVDGTDDEDAITFLDPSDTQVIGVFNNLFSHASDGLVDFIWNRDNDVYATVCGNRFERHDKAVLVHSGRSGREGGTYHITMCHNLWSDVYQRMPFSRDALVHQYNSVFEHYGKADGDGGGSKAGGRDGASHHLLEHNIAVPRRAGEETFDGEVVTLPRTEWAGPHLGEGGAVRIVGTWLETVDGVTAVETELSPERVQDVPYDYRLAPANPATRDAVSSAAGRCVPAGPGHIVPCAPLLLVEGGDSVSATVAGEVIDVRFDLDGAVLAEPRADGSGRWTVTFGPSTGGPGVLRVTATAPDGRTVTSDPIVVAVVS